MIRSFFVLTILTGGILLASVASLHADDGALDKMYGNGVHAFFSGDYVVAHDCLSRAIGAQTKDPRCFYFRGLAYLEMGREPEAKADFSSASDLEADDVYKFYNVSKALERIQGKSRMAIERYRVKARLRAAAEAQKLRQTRYEQLRAAETRVLQEQAAAAPAAAKPAVTKDAADPFSAGPLHEPAPQAAEKSVAKPAAPAAKEADPFADAPTEPAKPAPAKKSGGILGAMGRAVGKTAKDATSSLPKLGGKAAAAPAPNAMEPADEEEDPFAEEAPAAHKAAKPAAKPPAADDDDPFAEEAPPAPKAKKPAAKPPAADDDDPFAEEAPPAPKAKKPAPEAKKPEAKPAEIDPDDPFA